MMTGVDAPHTLRRPAIETLRQVHDVAVRMAKVHLNAGDWRLARSCLETAIMYDKQATAKTCETATPLLTEQSVTTASD